MNLIATVMLICFLLPSTTNAADRFTRIVEEGGEPTVTKGGYLVNQKRVAVQKELAQRPPTNEELGIKLPPGSSLMLEQTARQIAQYHPVWRIYQYKVNVAREALIQHFQAQGLTYDTSHANLKFGNASGDFIDGLSGDDQHQIRIWKKPQ
jgi:hypothetical protein